MNLLVIMKVKILMLIIKWPYRSLESCRLPIKLRMVSIFWTHCPISLWRQFLDPHLNTCQIIVEFDLGTSTLPCCVMWGALHRSLALVDGSETADEGRLVMTRSAASKLPTLEFGLVPARWLCPSAIITFWEHSRGDDRVDMHWPSSSNTSKLLVREEARMVTVIQQSESWFRPFYITLIEQRNPIVKEESLVSKR